MSSALGLASGGHDSSGPLALPSPHLWPHFPLCGAHGREPTRREPSSSACLTAWACVLTAPSAQACQK